MRDNFGIQRNSIIIGMEALHMDGWKMVSKGSQKEMLSFILQACYLVHVANQKGLQFTHRDFHPGNIMCKKNNRKRKTIHLFKGATIRPTYIWLFIDFGMSCITKFGLCNQQSKKQDIFLPPQEETPYSEDMKMFCGKDSQDYDMRLFFHSIYDTRDEMKGSNKPLVRFLENWLGKRFGKSSWHDSYGTNKTKKDKHMFSPEQCIKKVWKYVLRQHIQL
tara:strand:- start:468 stop:1124 length:657 start_codon:yes stop_codon:yes gene_type:complete